MFSPCQGASKMLDKVKYSDLTGAKKKFEMS